MDRIITKTTHHRRILFSALAALTFLGVIFLSSQHVFAAGESAPASEHIITLHDDGVDKGFITKQSTIREALKEQKIRLDDLDRTEPGLDQPLVANSYQVNVYRARPVVVRDGSSEVRIISSYRTPKQIARQANIDLHDEDITVLAPSSDPIADGVAEVMTITRATGFTFTFYGKRQQAYTMATTVGDMLKEKGITMSEADDISPSLDATLSAGMVIKLWRNGVQTVTLEEDIKFEIKQIEDADQPAGYKKVQTPGEKGRRTVTYEINMQNGKEVSRKEINSVTTKRSVQQVEIVGAKSPFGNDLKAAFAALRKCESGGNYANKNNPTYRGAYQFSYSTWANNGGYRDPADAPPALQDAAALALYERRGWSPWPACSKKLGL